MAAWHSAESIDVWNQGQDEEAASNEELAFEPTSLAHDFDGRDDDAEPDDLEEMCVSECVCSLHPHRFVSGYDGSPLHWIDSSTLVWRVANCLLFFRPEGEGGEEGGLQRTLWGHSYGIGEPATLHKRIAGPLAVLPARGTHSALVCFAEAGPNPAVFVYEWPDLRPVGAIKGLASWPLHPPYIDVAAVKIVALSFSRNGQLLAILGGLPDHTLTIWDWSSGERLASRPAGESETSVSFNPANSEQLVTLGAAHYTIWTVEHFGANWDLSAEEGQIASQDEAFSIAHHAWLPGGHILCAGTNGELIQLSPADPSGEGHEPSMRMDTLLGAEEAGSTMAMAVTRTHVIVGAADGTVRWLQYSNPREEEVEILVGDSEPVSSLCFSPTFLKLAVGSKCGGVFVMHFDPQTGPLPQKEDDSTMPDQWLIKMVDNHMGAITAVVALPDGHFYATAGLDGTVRIHDLDLALVAHKLVLNDEPVLCLSGSGTTLAAGTESGEVWLLSVVKSATVSPFTGEEEEQGHQMKLVPVFRARPHLSSVSKIALFHDCAFMATFGSDDRLFFWSLRPAVVCLGWVTMRSPILSIAWLRSEPRLLVSMSDGDVLSLCPADMRDQPDALLQLKLSSLHPQIMRLSLEARALTLAVTQKSVLVLSADRHLRAYTFNDLIEGDIIDDDLAIAMPYEECALRNLPGGCLVVSPNGQWVAVGGRDGTITLRMVDEISSEAAEHHRHDRLAGGVSGLAFTEDSTSLLVTGFDGAITAWKIADDLLGEVSDSVASPPAVAPLELPPFDSAKPPESMIQEARRVIEQQRELASKAAKDMTAQSLEKLRNRLRKLLEENMANEPIDQLSRKEFIVEEALVQHHKELAQQALSELQMRLDDANLSRDLVSQRVKSMCSDPMEVHGLLIKGLASDLSVSNFAIRKRSQNEIDQLKRIELIRRVELGALKRQAEQEREVKRTERPQDHDSDKDDEDEIDGEGERDGRKEDVLDLLYDPFELGTPARTRMQIHLLQKRVNEHKAGFNAEFAEVADSKQAVMSRITERTDRIQQIIQHPLVQDQAEALASTVPQAPQLHKDEILDSVLAVDDSEITAEHIDGEEQDEKETGGATEGPKDDSGDRGLNQMMGGRLEARGEGATDFYATDLEEPEWLLGRDRETLSDAEKKAAAEWEKEAQAHREEREKRHKTLMTELKKLKDQVHELSSEFDQSLIALDSRRIAAVASIHEDELRIISLVQSLSRGEEFAQAAQEQDSEEKELETAMLDAQSHEAEASKDLRVLRVEIDSLIARERGLDKQARRELELSSRVAGPALVRLYRKQPRFVKHDDTVQGFDPFHANDRDALAKEAAVAMPEPVDPAERPEGVDDVVWERFLELREEKISLMVDIRRRTQQVAQMERQLASLQNKLQSLTRRWEITRERGKRILDESERDQLNLEIMIKLKQGQVEVGEGSVITDYSDAILLDKAIVEGLNAEIRELGAEKVELLRLIKEANRRMGHLKWEHQRLDLITDDLKTKNYHIQMLRVTKQLQSLIKGGAEEQQQAEVNTLQRRLDHAVQDHKDRLRDKQKALQLCKRQLDEKKKENESLLATIKGLEIAVHQRQGIHAKNRDARGASNPSVRFDKISQGRKLKEIVKSQDEEIVLLKKHLHKLKARSFPQL